MLKKIARFLINTGSRLYKMKLFGVAKFFWGLPWVMNYSSVVNVKKYLLLLSDDKFEAYVEKHYFQILTDDDFFAWVETQTEKRKLSDLLGVIHKSIVADPSFALNRLSGLYSAKQFTVVHEKTKLTSLDKLSVVADDEQKLLLAVIYANDSFLTRGYKSRISELFLISALQYYRTVQIDAPNFILQIVDGYDIACFPALHYTYCQYQQVCGSLSEAIQSWQIYIGSNAADYRAKQNYLTQLAKANDPRLIDVMLDLDVINKLDERLIDISFRALNRINDVNLLVQASNIKKKTRHAERVILEVYRKHDAVHMLQFKEAAYVSAYGKDKWFSAYQAKKLIDYGEYGRAVNSFKKIKGQKLYYAVALLRDRQVEKAYQVMKKIKPEEKDYNGACRYLADIDFYEYKNWRNAVYYYDIALSYYFDYQLNLRKIKSLIMSGVAISDVDLSRVSREDGFYFKYLAEIVAGNYAASIRYLNQIYADGGVSPVKLMPQITFFDSLQGKGRLSVEGELVTVVMTAYKAKSFIKKAIDSILVQSYKNIELIVVEDHSPDDTYNFIRDNFLGKLRLLRTPKNSGTYVAKNIGMQAATGSLITFMDSDDWSHPDRIAMQVKYLNQNPAKIACQTGHLRMFEDGDLLYRKRGVNLDVPISLMIRRCVLDKIGYFDSVRASGDSEYIGRLKKSQGQESIGYISLPLIIARQGESSLTTSGATALTWAGMPKVRIDYRRSFRAWHSVNENLFLGFPVENRKFNAPKLILM